MALRHAVIVLFFVLASAAANAQTFAGDWTGVYTGSTNGCSPEVHFGAAAGLTITQSGSAISGTATLQGVIDKCKAIPAQIETAHFDGTVSGSTFTGTSPGGGTVFATLNGDSMTFTFSLPNGTGGGVVVRPGSTPVNLSGTWTGAFSAIDTACTPPQPSDVLMTLGITQDGSAISGTMSAIVSVSHCATVAPFPATIAFTGTVVGNTFTAAISNGVIAGYLDDTGHLTFAFGAGSGLGTGDLTLVAAPIGTFTGTYAGTYSGTRHRTGCPDAPNSGPLLLTLHQSGSTVTGTAVAANSVSYSGCTVTHLDVTIPVAGTVSSNTITLGSVDPNLGHLSATLTANGLTLAGNYTQTQFADVVETESGTLAVTLSGFAPAPTCTPAITAPSISQSDAGYDVTWSATPSTANYVIDESTSPSFSANVTSATTPSTFAVFTHSAGANTPYYYRVKASTCSGSPGTYSSTATTVVQARKIQTAARAADNVLPAGSTEPYTFLLFVAAPNAKTALDTGYSATTDQSYLKVSPPTGTIPPGGTTLTVTVTPAGLPPGANTGTVSVTPSSGAPINTPVSVSLVTPVAIGGKTTPPPNALIIPVVTHVNSASGPFQSDVRLTNAGSLPTYYQLTLTPTRSDGTQTGKITNLTVIPGQTIALNDIANDFFGFGATGQINDVGFGTLDIRPLTNTSSSLTYASSRTFVIGPTGTYGQFVAAIPFARFAGPGSVISLQQIAESSKFRTNLGVTEGSGNAANGRIRILDDNGTVLNQDTYSLQAGEHQQLNQYIKSKGITLDDGRIEITVDSPAGAITAYASVLDNVTADPLAVAPVDVSKVKAKRYVVPGMAELVSPFSNFHSDMRIYNGGSASVSVTPTYFPQGGSPIGAAPITINAGQVKAYDNVLPALFNVANTGGSILLTTDADSSLVATGRTYSFDSHNGTFGQFIPGVAPADGIGAGDTPLQLLQVEQSSQFRANVGVTELTGNSASVKITIIPADGRTSAVITLDDAHGGALQPNEFRQFNRIIETAYGSGAQMYNARIVVEVTGGSGRVAAYASVLDNSSLDPTYVPAQ